MNYSKYVLTFLGSVIAGVSLYIAFEEISSQTVMILITVFAVIGIGGEMIADVLEKKRKRKEAEREEKNREAFFLRLEEVINQNSQANIQAVSEKTDRVLEILNIHTLNFEEYLNFHVNHQKILENKVSELTKIIKNMDDSIVNGKIELQQNLEQIIKQLVAEREEGKRATAGIKEELKNNTNVVIENGQRISDMGNKLLEKIEFAAGETVSMKDCCADIFASEKQIMEEIAGRSSLLSEQCTEIKKQMQKEAELLRELKPILEQAEELKSKCDEMLRLEYDLTSKLGAYGNNNSTEISTVVNGNNRAFLGRIHNAMNKKGGR